MVLGHRDTVGHTGRLVFLLIELQLLDDTLHQRTRVTLVVDGEVGRETNVLRFCPENARKHRVERTHLQIAGIVSTHQSAYTLFHLACCLIGECERQDVPRIHMMMRQQISYLIRQHTRLTRACTSDNQLRTITIRDGFTLSLIELF